MACCNIGLYFWAMGSIFGQKFAKGPIFRFQWQTFWWLKKKRLLLHHDKSRQSTKKRNYFFEISVDLWNMACCNIGLYFWAMGSIFGQKFAKGPIFRFQWQTFWWLKKKRLLLHHDKSRQSTKKRNYFNYLIIYGGIINQKWFLVGTKF